MKQQTAYAAPLFPLGRILRWLGESPCYAGKTGKTAAKAPNNDEPFLDEMRADPLIQQLLAADNLSEQTMRGAIVRAQENLRRR
ncbi:MAG: hypothetical protein HQ483_10895 [Rhodospirillales bacterium]|nr:hypothetical protein [Rhodospirillales bacterium]